MGVKVVVRRPGETTRRLARAFERIRPELAAQVLSDCNAFVRMQTGELAASARVEQGGARVVWRAAYAKRVYYTGTPRKGVNPGASLRWCEKGKAAHKSRWAAKAKQLMGGG